MLEIVNIDHIEDDEKEQYVKDAMWVINTLAKKYSHRANINDLKSAGMEGLNRALEKFDKNKGVKFTSYAHWWIEAKMKKACYGNRSVHIPINRINQAFRGENILIPKEISFEGNSNDFYNESRKRDKIENQLSSSSTTVNQIDSHYLREHLEHAINNSGLSSVEKFVVYHKFGLDGGGERTLQEVGELMKNAEEIKSSYTAMGVKKAVDRALNKLYDSPFIKELVDVP